MVFRKKLNYLLSNVILASSKQYLIALLGKLGSCFLRVNLSSCAAEIISPSFSKHDALSHKNQKYLKYTKIAPKKTNK